MAIYKNREVSIIGPNVQANSPETINIAYKDGARENVSVAQVQFTDEEKTKLTKDFPSKYNDVKTAQQTDIDSVRAGVTPPSDPSYREAAERQVQMDKQNELIRKNTEAAKKEAEKQSQSQNNESKPAPATLTSSN